jgi:hypothetical protein
MQPTFFLEHNWQRQLTEKHIIAKQTIDGDLISM